MIHTFLKYRDHVIIVAVPIQRCNYYSIYICTELHVQGGGAIIVCNMHVCIVTVEGTAGKDCSDCQIPGTGYPEERQGEKNILGRSVVGRYIQI